MLADDIEWDQDALAYEVRLLEPGVGKQHVEHFRGDGKVSRFFHCIDRHAMVLAYGL